MARMEIQEWVSSEEGLKTTVREVSSLEPVEWLERALGTGFSHTEISEVLCGNGVPLPPLSPQDAVRIMAKDLVRTRRYVRKFVLMRANIQAVSLKIQTLKSNNSMAQAMKGVTKAMGTMNRQLKLPQIQKIMMEFERQAEIMDMKEEMMNDAIDDAMGDEDDEEESFEQGSNI